LCQDRGGSVKLYDLERSGYVIKDEVQTNHTGFARALKINEKQLAVPSENSDILIFDLSQSPLKATQKLSYSTDEACGSIVSMMAFDFSTDTTYILAGYESGHLVLWDLKESRIVHSLKFDFCLSNLDYDPSTNRGVASSPMINKIHVFGIDRAKLEIYQKDSDVIDLQLKETQRANGISALKVRSDKKCLIAGTCDGIVNIFSWKSLRKLATLRDHRCEITDIAFSTGPIDNFKSNISAIASIDGTVSLWDIYYK
jgi:WD40 repeat protein